MRSLFYLRSERVIGELLREALAWDDSGMGVALVLEGHAGGSGLCALAADLDLGGLTNILNDCVNLDSP